jgi:dimethylargininase
MTRLALTRAVSPAIGRAELTHLERRPIDVATASAQHRAYEAALRALGCEVLSLPADPALPDSVFVEDTAVVLDEVAVLARPGAASRRPETTAVADVLRRHRRLVPIGAPGTLEGGDVLRLGRAIYVGRSSRTNQAGIAQLAAAVTPYGYDVHPAPVRGCLHLKSAATLVGPERVLCNREWTDPDAFAGVEVLEVAPDEPHGANGLLVGERLIYPASFPATRRRLERAGVAVHPVDVSELHKAEGGVTCCSLVFEA